MDALNQAWWTDFWSHRYTDRKQIHSPSQRGEHSLHGLKLDWKRFVSDQLMDFVGEEINAVKQFSDRSVTTNMMGFFKPLNYFRWAKQLDFISWDCYPDWHSEENEYRIASETAVTHSLMRSLKKRPFWMMESTPSHQLETGEYSETSGYAYAFFHAGDCLRFTERAVFSVEKEPGLL